MRLDETVLAVHLHPFKAELYQWGVRTLALNEGGRFYFDRAPRETHLSAKTRERPEERERFWVTLCELVGADPEEDFR